ncbi:transposase [Pelagibaculum spongiae]|uniref:transposase n=1 Tax=Pelagibaculum spongiae TaxID=2080658 RepID=UPI0013148737|nr:transposase [Pelagibaculum spongiae]
MRWKGYQGEIRLVIRWNKKRKRFESLATNLPQATFSTEDVQQGYKLRWQIELLFKEWKILTNLKKFNTRNPEIAEGMIWTSLIGALLRRYLAYQAKTALNRVVSTWQVSKLGSGLLVEFWRWFARDNKKRAKEAWDHLLWLWREEGVRQNTQRDAKKGRCNSDLIIKRSLIV